MSRTRAGMERNTKMEALAGQFYGQDGKFDDEGYAAALAQFDPHASLEYRAKLTPKQPKRELTQIGDGVGGTIDVWAYPETGEIRDMQGQLISGSATMPDQAAPQAQQGPSGGLLGGGFDSVIGPLLEREGGYVANDAGAGPTNFGINSRANPDVDVKNLTPEMAKELYKSRYWDKINADNLPPAMQAAAFDASVNQGPGRAREWLAMAGNDPQKFAQLRQGHYDSLTAGNPQKYGQFAESWRNRNQETAGATAQAAPSPMQSRIGRRPAKAAAAADKDRYSMMAPAEVKALGLPEGTVA